VQKAARTSPSRNFPEIWGAGPPANLATRVAASAMVAAVPEPMSTARREEGGDATAATKAATTSST